MCPIADIGDATIAQVRSALLPVDITNDDDAVRREGQRIASVLMALVKRETWQVILTQRPETMPSHAGQISFPGGRRETGESALEAALRETHEEIGVKPKAVTVLGRLPSFDAVSDYRVTPFVGIIDPAAPLIPDPREVAELFEVPFAFIINPDNHIARDVYFDGREHRLYDMPYDGPCGTHRNIWGMTAMMMRRLYERGFAVDASDL